MAQVIITFKIMAESPEVDMSKVEELTKKAVVDFAGETETKTEIEPVAFGLKALKFIFVMDEGKGSTEQLEEKIKEIDGVQSVEVADVRRAIG